MLAFLFSILPFAAQDIVLDTTARLSGELTRVPEPVFNAVVQRKIEREDLPRIVIGADDPKLTDGEIRLWVSEFLRARTPAEVVAYMSRYWRMEGHSDDEISDDYEHYLYADLCANRGETRLVWRA